jgi:uncharacterized protein (DUF1684 family)
VLGVEPEPNISDNDWKELPEHREEGQVELDVNRSFVYYPKGAYGLRQEPIFCGHLSLTLPINGQTSPTNA